MANSLRCRNERRNLCGFIQRSIMGAYLSGFMDGDKMTTTYKFKAAFTKLGVGFVPGAAPTVTVVDKNGVVLANAVATTPRPNMTELFEYSYTGADNLDPVAKFATTDATVDRQHIYDDSYLNYAAAAAGAVAYAITINDSGGLPIDGVNVWISTDIAGVNVVFNGFTNALGLVTPLLDAGNYFSWKQKAGYAFTNPEAFSVP